MGPHSKMKLIEIFEKLQEILSKKSRYTNDLFIIYIFQKKNILNHLIKSIVIFR